MLEIDKDTLQYAEGSFPFKFYIEKAVAENESDGSMVVEGIASSANIDHDHERMDPNALQRMAKIINTKTVPLRVQHQKEDEAIIGKVNEAFVDERNRLHIKAILDKAHPTAISIHNALKNGTKLGLSVGGQVVRAAKKLAESLGKKIQTFYDINLQEVSVTPAPSNYDAWLVNKSIALSLDETFKFYDNYDYYNTFLFENPHLDYMVAIEKSIPAKSWKKVANQLKEKMLRKTSTESLSDIKSSLSDLSNAITELESSTSGSSSSSDSDLGSELASELESSSPSLSTESFSKDEGSDSESNTPIEELIPSTSSTSETSSTLKAIIKAIKGLQMKVGKIMKATTYTESEGSAQDQENPSESKSRRMRKASDDRRPGQENTYGDGSLEWERESGSDTESDFVPALDQQAPDTSKRRMRKTGTTDTSEELDFSDVSGDSSPRGTVSETSKRRMARKQNANESTGTTEEGNWFDSDEYGTGSSMGSSGSSSASKYRRMRKTGSSSGSSDDSSDESSDWETGETVSSSTSKARRFIKNMLKATEDYLSDSSSDTQSERESTGDSTEGDYTPALDSQSPTESKSRRRKMRKDSTLESTNDYDSLDDSGESETGSESTKDYDSLDGSSGTGGTESTESFDALDESGTEKDVSDTESEESSYPSSEDTAYGKDYEMPHLERSMGRLMNLSKALRVRGINKSRVSNLDMFVTEAANILNLIKSQQDRMGRRLVGLETNYVDMIRDNQTIQKAITDFSREPGQKRSISLGNVYMPSRDGVTYRLNAEPIGVSKSIDKTSTFKEVYGGKFSSTATGEDIGVQG